MSGAPAESESLWIETGPGGTRLRTDSLPIGLGGPDQSVPLDVPARGGRVAELTREEGQWVLRPVPGAAPVLYNDRVLEGPQVLRPGDRIRAGRSELCWCASAEGPGLARLDPDAGTLPPEQGAASEEPPDTLEGIEVTPVRVRPNVPLRRAPGASWGRAQLAAAIAGTALLWIALFSLRAVSVEVRSSPPGAEVRWPGSWLTLPIAERTLLLPGTHQLEVRLEGYRPARQKVELEDGASLEPIEVELEPLPGRLRVLSDPPGAQVRVDGEPSGQTPLERLELPPGSHRVRLEAPRYQPAEAVVEIEGRAVEQEIELALTPDFARVRIASEPPGAQVRVDGQALGSTPLALELDAGERSLQLELAGYEPHRQRVEVLASQPLELPIIALEPARGRLVLSSEPEGARVTLDGEYRGSTPLTLPIDPGEPHRLSLSKPGYQPASREVQLATAEIRELAIDLAPRLGTVEIRARPAAAQLRIDGEPRGSANQRVELPAIAHRIEVVLEGYETFRSEVVPRPGFEKRLDVTLVERRAAAPESPPETSESSESESATSEATPAAPALRIETPTGQALVLVQPGSLELGSAPGDPGRRANEARRRVVITRPFYLGTREITNAEFRRFRPEHRAGAVGTYTLDEDDQPAVQVSWNDAARFCNWLSERESLPGVYEERDGRMQALDPLPAGYRLPTEAEWALAARAGAPGTSPFPWGDQLPPPPSGGNYADQSAAELMAVTLTTYADGFPVTSPVGRFAPNPLGVYDLGGNVAEWIHDYYEIPVERGAPERDPVGPSRGVYHVIRGSSWRDATRTELRLEYRDYGDGPRQDVGFRIARSAP